MIKGQMRNNLNQLIGRIPKSTYNPAAKKGETMIENEQTIAETLNEYYSNVGSELSDQIPQYDTEVDHYIYQVSDEFKFKDITIKT